MRYAVVAEPVRGGWSATGPRATNCWPIGNALAPTLAFDLDPINLHMEMKRGGLPRKVAEA